MVSPGSSSETTRQRIRRVFSERPDPHAPLTLSEVAERADRPASEARAALDSLQAEGELGTKTVADRERVWWTPVANDSPDDALTPESEEFEALVNTVTEYAIFTLDPAGAVTSWNEGARRIKGYREDEIVGRHFSTFYTETAKAAGVPEHNMEAARAHGHVEDEGWRVRADGTTFWASVTITAVRDDDGTLQGFTKVTRDMTEQREYEEQLRRERDLIEQVLETVPVSVFVATTDGTVVRANARAEEELSPDTADLRSFGVDSWDVYDEAGEEIPRSELPWRTVPDTGEPVYHFECQVDLPDSGRRWLSMNVASLDDPEADEDRLVFAVDDISDRKERERELTREYNQTEKLLRTAPVAVAVRDSEGTVVLTNDRAEETLALTRDGGQGDADRRIYDDAGDPIPPGETPWGKALSTETAVYDESIGIETDGGAVRQFRVNAAPIFDSQGALQRVITTGEDITELKQHEHRLERRKSELETELSEMFGRISDAFYALDEDWRFTHLNERAQDVINPDDRQLLGKNIWEEFPEATERKFKPKLEEAMYEQETVSFEEYYPEPLDAWFEVRAYPSETGLSVYFRDVTERTERERKLRSSERRYRTLVRNFPDGLVALFDQDLRFIAAGGELLDTLDIDREEALGMTIEERYSEEFTDEVLPHFEAALRGEERTFEVDFEGRNLLAHTIPTDPDSPHSTGMLVVQDITEQREYERKLVESNERLEQFAYAASHDLQEPLRMVSSYLTLIENRYADALDEDGREFLEFAVGGADRMRDMIDGLLAYSRIDTRGDSFEPVDLNAVLEDVCEDLCMRIRETDADIDAETLPRVPGDDDQLRQVFQNLLDNAIEYSGDEPPAVRITADRDGDRWTLSVHDEGIGIDQSDTDRIFQVFQSFHSGGERPGTGIGLALCRRIVERHGGRIWVADTPGEGSTLRFTLPAEGDS